MLRNLHELRQGDCFRFTAQKAEEIPLPQGPQQVVSCWGVRTPAGTAVPPWMLACRDGRGVLHNVVLPPTIRVEVESP
jgi:hypothetical protein